MKTTPFIWIGMGLLTQVLSAQSNPIPPVPQYRNVQPYIQNHGNGVPLSNHRRQQWESHQNRNHNQPLNPSHRMQAFPPNRQMEYSRSYHPSYGTRIHRLPNGCQPIYGNMQQPMYFHQGFYYGPAWGGGYEIVRPQMGAIITHLPAESSTLMINGQVFYQYANIIYQAVQVGYAMAYQVVGVNG